MNRNERISAFSTLGAFLSQFPNDEINQNFESLNKQFYDVFLSEIKLAEMDNRWFIKEHILQAFDAWGKLLNNDNLTNWTKKYSFSTNSKNIGVVQAGNIPLVGFHDFLSVLISGHRFIGKSSSKDRRLPQLLGQLLIAIEPRFSSEISWVERVKDVDAIIATGSDNTARYFEYYFGKKPNIIRKNRSSWAILTGKETPEDLYLLGKDIFSYYGLGCRNISKLFVPDNYDFKNFFEAIEPFYYVYNNNKYANNYDYNQSVYLMNLLDFLQNGFVILKEDIGHHSPLSVVFYENYSKIETVQNRIKQQENEIQCICSSNSSIQNTIPFGKSQEPELWDYADNIDTLDFLSNL